LGHFKDLLNGRCKVNESEHELTIRRILVALDASTHSLAALEAAADLAASLQAELVGLFVEDENLLHLAGLPFAREVRSPSATDRRLNSDQMEQQLRLQASQARRAMAAAAERVQVRWTFQVVRGQVTPAVLTAALEADLLAMGRISRPLMRRSRLGSTARAVSTTTKGSVLLIQDGSDLSQPVLVTYDGSPAARQALAAAAILAQGGSTSVRAQSPNKFGPLSLEVLLVSDKPEETPPLKEEVSRWLKKQGLTANFHSLPQATVPNLARMVLAAGNCVLVLGGDNPLLTAEAIQELLDETDCPVLLVR
jgi:nucleotide-binding universal stress UspA family protein